MAKFDKDKKDKKDVKSINIEQVVSYLNHSFAEKSREVFGPKPNAVKGTAAYAAQVQHCYFIDEIQRGPTYMLPKVIGEANDHIAALKKDK